MKILMNAKQLRVSVPSRGDEVLNGSAVAQTCSGEFQSPRGVMRCSTLSLGSLCLVARVSVPSRGDEVLNLAQLMKA